MLRYFLVKALKSKSIRPRLVFTKVSEIYMHRFCSNGAARTPRHSNSIHRILLTGGPSAGKSTALSTLQNFLLNHGFVVYTIPEASTLLQMQGGIQPSLSTLPFFQRMVTKTQNDLEGSYCDYANDIVCEHPKTRAVILIDRGIMDGNAYVQDRNEFAQVLQYALNQSTETPALDTNELIRKKYDMILHLVTAANGAERFYTKEVYRSESVEEAIALDDRIQQIYSEHHDRRIIGNAGTFDDKLQLIVSHVADKLNIPNLSRKTLRFLVSMKQEHITDVREIIDQLQRCIVTEQGENAQALIVTFVIKHFLRHDVVPHDHEGIATAREENYKFVRETNLIHIDGDQSIEQQIADIRASAQHIGDEFERINIPRKAGSAWTNATHYMQIETYEENGQLINKSQNLAKRQYNELRQYNTDPHKQRVEKIKIFFHHKAQFYALDVFSKPDSHKGHMWLKVYRGQGNKYMSMATGAANTDVVDVPACLQLHKNVTKNPDFTSYSFSDD